MNEGGAVSGGSPFQVGEHGPEWVVLQTPGHVVPATEGMSEREKLLWQVCCAAWFSFCVTFGVLMTVFG